MAKPKNEPEVPPEPTMEEMLDHVRTAAEDADSAAVRAADSAIEAAKSADAAAAASKGRPRPSTKGARSRDFKAAIGKTIDLEAVYDGFVCRVTGIYPKLTYTCEPR